MTSTFTSYAIVTRDLARSIDAVKKQPQVDRETDYYLSKIGAVKSVDDFLADRRLVTYAMKAHGLEDMAYAKAFIRKVLDEGRDAPDAFVNKLTDKRYLAFAETFDFKRYGAATTTFGRAQQGVVDKYLRQTLEEQQGATNDGVRLALYFERQASKITSPMDILADKALSTVVRTALGMPDAMASLDVDKQAAIIKSRLDVADFADPEKLSAFITRFAALWDVGHAEAATDGVGLLLSGGPQYGISSDLMLSILQTKG